MLRTPSKANPLLLGHTDYDRRIGYQSARMQNVIKEWKKTQKKVTKERTGVTLASSSSSDEVSPPVKKPRAPRRKKSNPKPAETGDSGSEFDDPSAAQNKSVSSRTSSPVATRSKRATNAPPTKRKKKAVSAPGNVARKLGAPRSRAERRQLEVRTMGILDRRNLTRGIVRSHRMILDSRIEATPTHICIADPFGLTQHCCQTLCLPKLYSKFIASLTRFCATVSFSTFTAI